MLLKHARIVVQEPRYLEALALIAEAEAEVQAAEEARIPPDGLPVADNQAEIDAPVEEAQVEAEPEVEDAPVDGAPVEDADNA